MNLAKYVSLLTRKRLYLPCLERLGDPFEGSLPVGLRERATADTLEFFRARGDLTPQVEGNVRDGMMRLGVLAKEMRRVVYVSCWRLSDQESEAMWRLYCGSNEGVAIVLSYDRLAASLSGARTQIGMVSYIDYQRDEFPWQHLMHPVMHKRKAFEHECEVRIVASGDWEASLTDPNFMAAPAVELPWDPEVHVERVVVNPYAMPWYHDVVRDVTAALAPTIRDRVCESGMATEPTF